MPSGSAMIGGMSPQLTPRDRALLALNGILKRFRRPHPAYRKIGNEAIFPSDRFDGWIDPTLGANEVSIETAGTTDIIELPGEPNPNNSYYEHPGITCRDAQLMLDHYREAAVSGLTPEVEAQMVVLREMARHPSTPEAFAHALDVVLGRLDVLGSDIVNVCSHRFWTVVDETLPEEEWRIRCTLCHETDLPYPNESEQ